MEKQDMSTPRLEVGKTYRVSTARNGTFCLRVVSSDDTWTEGVITDGTASAMMSYNVRHEGEAVTLRNEFIRSSVEIA
jgi:hypothetical protein